MPKISVNYQSMAASADQLRSQAGKIKSITNDISEILNNMPLSTEYYTIVMVTMGKLLRIIADHGDKYNALAQLIEQIIEAYKRGDGRAMDELGDDQDPDNPNNLSNHNVPSDWNRIPGDHDMESDLSEVNPNYDEDRMWKVNCQRCVPTYELRRRGYDVTALPAPSDADTHLAYHPFDAWENPDVHNASGNGYNDIVTAMEDWPDGSRAQVVVEWDGVNSGHTFIAEKIDGEVHFIDPQSNETDVSYYFDNVEEGSTRFARIDNLEPSSYITDCCKEAD